MKVFFKSIDEIDRFTANLDLHRDSIECQCCGHGDNLVSHGYRTRNSDLVGKRLHCSPRRGHSGCGATIPLYLTEIIPNIRYSATCLAVFITLLLSNHSIENAYHKATECTDTRNAYRWLNKLDRQLIRYRTFIISFTAPASDTCQRCRSARLTILLPTLRHIFNQLAPSPCHHYQERQQKPFI